MSTIQAIQNAVINGKHTQTVSLVQTALEAGVGGGTILNEALIPAMTEVGRQFEARELYIPELVLAARAMREGIKVLTPHLRAGDIRRIGKVVIGTVAGDLHDIGKNLVTIMVEGAGFEVKDLGVDVSPQRFMEAVRSEHPDLLMLSALITSTLDAMRRTIEELREAGLRDKVKVLVGGAPVTSEYAQRIGADGYSPDAGGAARLAAQMVGKVRTAASA